MFFSTVFAAICNPATGCSTQTGSAFFSNFIPKIVAILFVVGSLAFFFMFMIGAVRWILSGGDKAAVESARAQITQALTGLVVMFSIWAIATLIKAVFGYDLININFGNLLNTTTV